MQPTIEYSAAHAEHFSLMDWYHERVAAQEQMYVEAGFPAEGLAEFLATWFAAWEHRDIAELDSHLAHNMVYADPTIGSADWTWDQESCDLYHWALSGPGDDMVFFAQGMEPRALPTFDFLDGFVRLTVPWRAVGHVRLFLLRRAYDVVGVDRYDMVREDGAWKIARIDTDADVLGALLQVLPIPLRMPSQATVHRAVGVARRVFPALRAPDLRPR